MVDFIEENNDIIFSECPKIKNCSICGKEKDLSEFYFRKDSGKYRNECKECHALKGKDYDQKHKEEMKQYYIKNIDRKKKQSKKYREDNQDKIKEARKNYQPIKTKRHLERLKTDVKYKIANKLRIRLNDSLKGQSKTGSAVKDLGCSIEELKQHLELKFYSNPETGEMMSWQNYGLFGWHIDHIIPLVSFDLTDREQFLKACHYTNLQPLWAKENLEKGSKII